MTKSTFMAACAEIDITPELPITLAGSLSERHAKSIADPLFARLLLVANGKTSLLFMLLDVIGISNQDANLLRETLSQSMKLPQANICVACTHTHSGPAMMDAFDSKKETAYVEKTLQEIIAAATKLYSQLQPAEVAWGTGFENRPAYNRRYILKDGTLKTNPGIGNPEILHPAGPTDPAFPVLLLRNINGEPLAVLASFSLHYVGADGGDVISADYFGAFSRAIKSKYGNQCVAMLAHGASGDINNVNAQQKPEPWFPDKARPSQKCAIVGEMLADQVEQIWNAATYHKDVPIAATESTFVQRVHKIDDRKNDEAKANDASLSQMERVFARERLLLLDYPDVIEMPMLAWRIGDWAMATFTGQMFAQCALDLRYASPFETTAIVELANGWGGYVGRRMDYLLGGYEMQLARSSFAMPGTGEEMLCEAIENLRKV
jgi:hypothetical protein